MVLTRPLYDWYARRLRRRLAAGPLPRHIALVMDGNRRWARKQGYGNPSVGHRYGAEHLETVLGWCAQLGITDVTVYVCSIDNLHKRAEAEVAYLLQLIEEVVAERVAGAGGQWQLHLTGRVDVLPDSTRHALKLAAERTAGRGLPFHVTLAVGYDGRTEIVDAVRALLDEAAAAGTPMLELAARLTDADIGAYVTPTGRPDPDLILRTSGEQRLSGFLLWQSPRAHLHFAEAYWPGFRHVDFLRALRTYAERRRG